MRFLLFTTLVLFLSNSYAQDLSWSGNAGNDDFFDENNWIDNSTSVAPPAGTIDPNTAIDLNISIQNADDITANGIINIGAGSLTLQKVKLSADAISNGTLNLDNEAYVSLSSSSPIQGNLSIDLKSSTAWVKTLNLKPTDVNSSFLNNLSVNQQAAVYQNNLRLDNYYLNGTIVRGIENTSKPLEIFDDINLQGNSADIDVDIIWSSQSDFNSQPIPNGLDNQIESFVLKKGFMVTFAVNDDGTGKSKNYIASEEDLILNELPTYLQNNISFIRILPWNWVEKKGKANPSNVIESDMDNAWFYNWNKTLDSSLDVEYVPMSWGTNGADEDDDITDYQGKYKATHLLGFNESDNCDDQSGQYNNLCQVDVAVGLYRNLMKTGMRLVSPSGRENAPFGWLKDFYDLATQENVRIDVIGVHWYDWGSNPASSPNADANDIFQRFVNYLDNVHDLYGLPIWITEFNANPNRTNTVNYEFMQLALPYLESLDYIERYAWYQPNSGVADYYDANENLTNVGTFYKNHVSTPAIPEATIQDNNNFDNLFGNLVLNPNFESGVVNSDNNIEGWNGFNNRILEDNQTNSRTGHINANEGSIFQVINVIPGESYDFSFDYKWLNNGQPNMNMTVRVRNEANNNIIASIPLNSVEGSWDSASTVVTIPAGVTQVRLLFYKASNNKPFRLDNVVFKLRECNPPSNVINVELSSKAGFFKWDASANEFDGYDWVVVESGNNPDAVADIVSNGSVSSGTLSVSVIGLIENTAYDFYVRTRCEYGKSDWFDPVNFTPTFRANLMSNARFNLDGQTGTPTHWSGFNHQVLVDEQTGELVGNLNNGEASFFQPFNVVPGVEYALNFNYKWVSNSGNYNSNVTVRELGSNNIIQTLSLNSTPDQWFSGTILFAAPQDVNEVKILFYKYLNNNPLRFSNISVLENLDLTNKADFVYKNGNWSPSDPNLSSTTADDIYIFNSNVQTSDPLVANNFEVEPWSDVNVYSSLNLSGNLINNGKLTFKSNASGSGQLGEFFGSISGTEDIVVERFIPAQTENNRAFRFLTSSVNSSTPIYNNWQESGHTPDGLGTHITGSATGDNGFDQTISGNPSMFTFDNTFTGNQDNAWSPVSDTDTSQLNAGEAYLLFVRGDRNYNLNSNPADAPNSDVILRSKGSLETGNQTFNLSQIENYYSLVGNPYQAQVNINNVNFTNVNTNSYWVWDPSLTPNGGYVTVSLTLGTTPSSSDANHIIQPGQSFFVQTLSNAAASLTFLESAKAVSELPTTVFNENQDPNINIRIYDDQSLVNNQRESDAVGIYFSTNGNNEKNSFDADKLNNPNVNLARLHNNEQISIENRALPVHDELLELYLAGYIESNNTFVIELSNFDDDFNVYLKDNYLDNETLLNNGTNQIGFSVDFNIPNSTAPNRFALLFENTTLNLNDNVFEQNMSLYPNPTANGKFSINTQNVEGENVELLIHDMLGQVVLRQELRVFDNQINVNAGNLSAGVYFVELKHNENQMTSKLIIK